MASNRPDSRELIEAIREMMESHLLPALEDQNLVYQCRVSVNILRIVERELQQRAAMDTGEQQRLRQLLELEGDLDSLNRELVQRIRQGAFDSDDAALLDHLKATTLDKIAIDNPRYSTYRDYLEQGELTRY
ncbi:MAG: DUF6285 domain-containing protein [Parahaliea sp.]